MIPVHPCRADGVDDVFCAEVERGRADGAARLNIANLLSLGKKQLFSGSGIHKVRTPKDYLIVVAAMFAVFLAAVLVSIRRMKNQ